MIERKRIETLLKRVAGLSDRQLIAIENIVAQFEKPFTFQREPESDLVSDCVLQEFGDTLRIHHCFSREAFTKDKFEHALVRVYEACGVRAELATRGNRGHDVTLHGAAFSLKTEAAAAIKAGFLHISKFMELGSGEWSDKIEDLIGLRDQFFRHMTGYERLLTLRKLPKPGAHFYELVEIPKALLMEAVNGEMKMMVGSKQNPKPGACTVKESNGNIKFELYFDGGTERKLQIKRIDKRFCVVHAAWQWDDDTKITEAILV